VEGALGDLALICCRCFVFVSRLARVITDSNSKLAAIAGLDLTRQETRVHCYIESGTAEHSTPGTTAELQQIFVN